MPGKRMSKENRAKILSVYFRPWTLVKKVATEIVPFLAHLHMTRASTKQPAIGNIRRAWKEYSQQVLPHAKAQLQNFMLACMAEGKTHPDEEEAQGYRRGTSLYCKLTLEEVQAALNFQAKKATQKPDVNRDAPEEATTLNKRVMETASIAQRLAAETARAHGSTVDHKLRFLRNHVCPPKSRRQTT